MDSELKKNISLFIASRGQEFLPSSCIRKDSGRTDVTEARAPLSRIAFSAPACFPEAPDVSGPTSVPGEQDASGPTDVPDEQDAFVLPDISSLDRACIRYVLSFDLLEDFLSCQDETFSQMLCRKIREKGMSNADCYKKSCLDRRVFSKILSDIHYKPQKKTAFAFALGLELSMEEAEELLMKAGYAFSDSQVFDLIVKYFIRSRCYDIPLINQVLWEHDQPLLGAGQMPE